MKKIILALLSIGLVLSAPAQSQLNPELTLTNAIPLVSSGATSNSTAYVTIANHEEVAVQWRNIWSATNASGFTLVTTFGASTVPSNFVAIATHTSSAPTAATDLTRNLGTNIYLGSFKYFTVMSMVSSATNSTVTNVSPTSVSGQMKLQFKSRRNGSQ